MVCSIGIFSKRIDGEQVQKIILAWAAENEENRLQHHYRPGTYTTRTAHTLTQRPNAGNNGMWYIVVLQNHIARLRCLNTIPEREYSFLFENVFVTHSNSNSKRKGGEGEREMRLPCAHVHLFSIT